VASNGCHCEERSDAAISIRQGAVGPRLLCCARNDTESDRHCEGALMQAWYLCENPYPFVPEAVLAAAPSVRGSLPNKYCDPEIAAQLFEECLDEYLLCDELGINIIANEHHSGINCLYGASPLILGILARQTRNVRILSLGALITVRADPVRAAEEYATADVISRGRLDIGFVKSGGSEMAAGNANPVGIRERFWEAIDLITKALSYQEGRSAGRAGTSPTATSTSGRDRGSSRTRHCGPPPATPRRRASWAAAASSTRSSCAASRGQSAPGAPIAKRVRRQGCRRP
jgi:hypothetical protein